MQLSELAEQGEPTNDVTLQSRRAFLVAAAVSLPGAMLLGGCVRDGSAHADQVARWRYLTGSEPDFLRAALARLIPADDLGPGAVEAGVDRFIDAQLAGDYGRATRWYMQGPFHLGTEQQGYQLALTPAQVYRVAIPQIDDWCRKQHGKAFAALDDATQDAVLHALEKGDMTLEMVPAKTFFDLLWTNTQEGFLSDPVYGGNRHFAGWKLIGFPGPRYNYVDDITRYGKPYEQPYVSLGGRQPKMEV